MKLSENEIVRALHALIDDADDDMLAWFAGDMFGGNCEYMGLLDYDFEFTPNENYMGAFDKSDK
jgi:hypothetical protein